MLSQLSKRSKIEIALTLLCAGLLLAPLFLIAHGCDDDLAVSVARNVNGSYFGAAWNAATAWGRFYEVVAYNMAQIPFLSQNSNYTNFFRFLATATALLTLWLFVSRLTRSISLACLSTTATAAFLYTGPGYNPFHCYPLWFQPPITLSFLSWWIYLGALREKSRKKEVLSAITIFGAMLFYEPFVLFPLGHFLIYLWEKRDSPESPVRSLVHAIRDTRYYWGASILYVTIFFTFQKFYPSTYGGSKPSVPPIYDYFITWLRTTIPTVQFSRPLLIKTVSRLIEFKSAPAYLFVGLFVVAVSLSAWLALKDTDKLKSDKKRLLLAVLAAVFFVFLPNAIYGFTAQYRNYAAKNLCAPYIGTFYSTFFVGLGSMLLGVALVLFTPRRFRAVTKCLFCVGIALITLVSASRTVDFATHWMKTRRIWGMAETFRDHMKTNEAKPSTMLAPRLWTTYALTVPDEYDYWTNYFRMALKTPIKVFRYPKDVKDVTANKVLFLEGGVDPKTNTPVVAFGSMVATPSFSQNLTLLSGKDISDLKLYFELQRSDTMAAPIRCPNAETTVTASGIEISIPSLRGKQPLQCEVLGANQIKLDSMQVLD